MILNNNIIYKAKSIVTDYDSSTISECDCLEVITDSREITANSIFIALEGDSFDGFNFINKNLCSTAKVVVYRTSAKRETLLQDFKKDQNFKNLSLIHLIYIKNYMFNVDGQMDWLTITNLPLLTFQFYIEEIKNQRKKFCIYNAIFEFNDKYFIVDDRIFSAFRSFYNKKIYDNEFDEKKIYSIWVLERENFKYFSNESFNLDEINIPKEKNLRIKSKKIKI